MAQADFLPGDRDRYRDFPAPDEQPVPAPTFDGGDVRRRLESVSRGIQVTDDDVRDAMRINQGESLDSRLNDFAAQYERRAKSGQTGSGVDSTTLVGGNGRVQATPFSNPSPQFNDPSAQLLENYALDRFRQRQNPDPNSGTALYENYLRQYFETLQGAPYSPTEEAQIKQTAYNDLERERTSTRERWLEEVSRRNILPSSGIALDGLRRIDEHYGKLRADADNSFARGAIDMTRQNRAQAASVSGALATNEEGRLSDALTYAMLPLSLQDRSFNMGLQLTGLGGNPAGLSSSATSILGMLQQANQMNSANRASSINAIMQYLASIYG